MGTLQEQAKITEIILFYNLMPDFFWQWSSSQHLKRKAIWYVSVKHLGIETFMATTTALITAQYWILWQSFKKTSLIFVIFIKLDSKFNYLLITWKIVSCQVSCPSVILIKNYELCHFWNINNGNKHFWFCHLLCFMKTEKY